MYESYIKSIKANITKREKAIERHHKAIEHKKELNKKFGARVKELEKLAAGKGKPAKKAKAKKAKAPAKKKVVFRIAKPA